jgi:hypothetical protein
MRDFIVQRLPRIIWFSDFTPDRAAVFLDHVVVCNSRMYTTPVSLAARHGSCRVLDIAIKAGFDVAPEAVSGWHRTFSVSCTCS